MKCPIHKNVPSFNGRIYRNDPFLDDVIKRTDEWDDIEVLYEV